MVSNWGEFNSEIESKKDSLNSWACCRCQQSAASTTGTETASDSASGSAPLVPIQPLALAQLLVPVQLQLHLMVLPQLLQLPPQPVQEVILLLPAIK